MSNPWSDPHPGPAPTPPPVPGGAPMAPTPPPPAPTPPAPWAPTAQSVWEAPAAPPTAFAPAAPAQPTSAMAQPASTPHLQYVEYRRATPGFIGSMASRPSRSVPGAIASVLLGVEAGHAALTAWGIHQIRALVASFTEQFGSAPSPNNAWGASLLLEFGFWTLALCFLVGGVAVNLGKESGRGIAIIGQVFLLALIAYGTTPDNGLPVGAAAALALVPLAIIGLVTRSGVVDD